MSYVFPPPAVVSVPVIGRSERFPVARVYCVGRNYEEHAKEMGFTGREPPFFFMKPACAVIQAGEKEIRIPYPPKTSNFHYEIELVEFSQQFHSDLPATKLRGYRQRNAPGGPAARDGEVPEVAREAPLHVEGGQPLDRRVAERADVYCGDGRRRGAAGGRLGGRGRRVEGDVVERRRAGRANGQCRVNGLGSSG